MTVFDAEFNKVIGSLENIHEKLVHSRVTYETNEAEQQIGENYQTTEQRNASMWG